MIARAKSTLNGTITALLTLVTVTAGISLLEVLIKRVTIPNKYAKVTSTQNFMDKDDCEKNCETPCQAIIRKAGKIYYCPDKQEEIPRVEKNAVINDLFDLTLAITLFAMCIVALVACVTYLTRQGRKSRAYHVQDENQLGSE